MKEANDQSSAAKLRQAERWAFKALIVTEEVFRR
jgi:hypothetical protein